jgi:hypothetical protein
LRRKRSLAPIVPLKLRPAPSAREWRRDIPR